MSIDSVCKSLKSCILAPADAGCLPHIWIEHHSIGIPEPYSCDIGSPPIPHFSVSRPPSAWCGCLMSACFSACPDYATPVFDPNYGITTFYDAGAGRQFRGLHFFLCLVLSETDNSPSSEFQVSPKHSLQPSSLDQALRSPGVTRWTPS